MVVGIAVLATNLVAAGWGVIGWLRKDARASIVFWPLLRLAQATVVVQAVLGFLLVARGASSPDGLHIVYGVSPLVIALVSEGMRVGIAQREIEGVEDIEALERSGAGGAGEAGGTRGDGRDDRGRAADTDAGAARLSDGRLGESGVRQAEHHAEEPKARDQHRSVDRLDQRAREDPRERGGAGGHRCHRHRREHRKRQAPPRTGSGARRSAGPQRRRFRRGRAAGRSSRPGRECGPSRGDALRRGAGGGDASGRSRARARRRGSRRAPI